MFLFQRQARFRSVWQFRGHVVNFLRVSLFSVTGCRPLAHPPTWRTITSYLETPGRVAQLYPQAKVLSLIALLKLHELQWDCSELCSLVNGDIYFGTKNTAWARYRVPAADSTRNNSGLQINFTDIYVRSSEDRKFLYTKRTNVCKISTSYVETGC